MDATTGFLSPKEMSQFLDYGLMGFGAFCVLVFAFLIFTMMTKKAVKAETMTILNRFFILVLVIFGSMFAFAYLEMQTVSARVTEDIVKYENQADELAETISKLELEGWSDADLAQLRNAQTTLAGKLRELNRYAEGETEDPQLLKDTEPYAAMSTPERLVAIGKTKLGTPYLWSLQAVLPDTTYDGPWDNSEFMGWVVYQATGNVMGCLPKDPEVGDCYTGHWAGEPGNNGVRQSVDWGLASEGGILIRLPMPAEGKGGKVGISLGDGRFIEASRAGKQVQISDARLEGYWDFAVQLN